MRRELAVADAEMSDGESTRPQPPSGSSSSPSNTPAPRAAGGAGGCRARDEGPNSKALDS
eukprot:6631123-Prymnesium_polylepis.2